MHTLVMLARGCLRVHQGYLRWNFAKFPREIARTHALVIVHPVHAGSAILAHVILAVIDVYCAVFTLETGQAFASVVSVMIDTSRVVFARIVFDGAEGDFRFAELSWKKQRFENSLL